MKQRAEERESVGGGVAGSEEEKGGLSEKTKMPLQLSFVYFWFRLNRSAAANLIRNPNSKPKSIM